MTALAELAAALERFDGSHQVLLGDSLAGYDAVLELADAEVRGEFADWGGTIVEVTVGRVRIVAAWPRGCTAASHDYVLSSPVAAGRELDETGRCRRCARALWRSR